MSNKEQTLVVLTPGFAASEADSTCLPMQQSFVKTLKKNYPHINIVILSFQYPYRVDSYQWFDVTVRSFNGRNKGGLLTLLLRQKVFAELKRIHQESKVIGLLSFWYGECALVGKRFAAKNNIKHYCWLLGQDARKTNKYPLRVKPDANELIALSDFLQDEFERSHGVKPVAVVPPGIDKSYFTTAAPTKDIDILAAGSLIPLKQFHIFLEVIAEIKKIFPNIKAVLIGEGPEREKLQFLIKKLGLENNVTLAGKLAHNDVLQQMQRAKVFLHPSSYEGFGVVCLEALYSGAQVISFVKPMYKTIEHWHIATSKEGMIQKALEILKNSNTPCKSTTVYSINDTAKKIMSLFHC
jgi:glycosyltransferase involved in cell wall biosynthesis